MFNLFKKKCDRCGQKSRDTIKVEDHIMEKGESYSQDYYTTIYVCPRCIVSNDKKL
jgi:hypothetical protein